MRKFHIQWGTVYEISSTETVFSVSKNEEDARWLVAQSPTDTGLVKRYVSEWEPAS